MSEKLEKYFKGDSLAADVWQGKYSQPGEETPDDMHRRLAKEFARVENNYEFEKEYSVEQVNALSEYGKNRNELLEEDIYNLFKDFKYIVPQGSIMSQLGVKSIGSLSNCFVIGAPEDSYGGIFQKDEEMAQLMKRRGGVGIDISTLRPAGTPTSNAAKSSTGAISFMHRFSNTTREVAQNGRRGALMLSIDINHPDVMEFIKIKRDLTQVTGANISIKLNNEFMKAVENNEDYILRFPCDFKIPEKITFNIPYDELVKLPNSEDVKWDGTNPDGIKHNPKYIKRIKAKEYWDEIIKSAHNVAEPGIIFENNHHNHSPDGIYSQFKGITTNPCGEIFMQPYDACRLIAVNLFSFVENPFTDKAYFNFNKFYEYNYEAMRLSDDLIDLELEHIDRIVDKIMSDPEPFGIKERELGLWLKVKKTAAASRRTGLGFTALGDTLAALGLGYDSDEGLKFIEQFGKTKLKSELDCTIDLAITRGPFKGWSSDIEFNHKQDKGNNSFYQMLAEEFPEQTARMIKYGRRNVSWSTIAPTGTVSLMTQTTSGIEPLYQPFYMRRKKVNPSDENVKVDFTDQNGDTWQEFPVLHPKLKEWIHRNKILAGHTFEELSKEQLEYLFEESPWYGSTANDINWIKRVEIQAILQKYITHSISSTINLPEEVTEKEVSEIYLESWKQGLKGITVYRDGSRSGVLVSDKKENAETFKQSNAPKRPKDLPCSVYTTSSKGVKWNVVVGILEGKPYEVFAVPYFTDIKEGVLSKVKRGRYDLLTKDGETYSEDITSEMNSEQEAITRLTSTSLRHGANIKFVVEQLNKSYGDITSFSKAISRILKKYIPDGETTGIVCGDCQSSNVVMEEGCNKCLDCGNSAC